MSNISSRSQDVFASKCWEWVQDSDGGADHKKADRVKEGLEAPPSPGRGFRAMVLKFLLHNAYLSGRGLSLHPPLDIKIKLAPRYINSDKPKWTIES